MDKTSLDLSKFKHVKGDKESTTLEHHDGHQIVLKHKALSPEFQAALGEMASHGAKKPSKESKKEPVKLADGGDVPAALDPKSAPYDPMQDPGAMAAGAATLNDGALTPVQSAYNNSVMSHSAMDMGGAGFDPGAAADKLFSKGDAPKSVDINAAKQAAATVQKQEATAAASKTAASEQMAKENEARAAIGLPPLAMPPGSQGDFQPTPQESSAMAAQAQPQGQGGAGYDPRTDAQGMFFSGYNKSMQGFNAEAKAQGDLGEAQANLLDQSVQAKQLAVDSFNKSYHDIDQDIQHTMNDIRTGYIDPNQYWTGDKNGNGSHSKIAAGIGMILAGFNPVAGAPNAAMDFMKYQMNQNLEAQKANLGAKENLLNANFKRFGNMKDATEMTNIMQQQMVAQQLQAAAGKAASPLAKAAALKYAGQFQMTAANMTQTFAMQHAMVQMANQNAGQPQSDQATQHMLGYLRAFAPDKAKEMEQRYVPGVGVGAVPVPAEARQKIIAQQDVDRSLQQAMQFAKKNAGSLDPQVRAQGSTMMNELQSKIRTAEGQGVYKESEAHFISQTLGDNPASLMANYTTVPKLKEMLSLKRAENDTMLKSYGLPVKSPTAGLPPQAQADLARAKAQGPKVYDLVAKHYGVE